MNAVTTPYQFDLIAAEPPLAVVRNASTPYYRGERATLYLGDCREIVPTLPRQSVDLLIADPPYGTRWQSGRRIERFDEMVGDDGSVDWPTVLGAITRHALRNHRHVYVFGYRPADLTEPLGLGGHCELIWDKGHLGPGALSAPWGPEHETFTFGQYEWSRVNRAKGSGRLSARLRQGSVLQAKRPNSGQVRHPDEKPVDLLLPLVESSSCRNDLVLDPTCGVGSTVVAAVLAGRRAIGIEMDERYLSIAVDRVREAERIAKLAEVV